MDEKITSFDTLYRKHYKDDIENDKERERLVGKFMMPALQNDDEAIDKIIQLLIDPSFAVIRNAMLKNGDMYKSLELMEDMMQEITEVIKGVFFRGIPESVLPEELMKYLLGVVRHSIQRILGKKYQNEVQNPSLEQWEEDGKPLPVQKVEEDSEGTDDFKNQMLSYCIKCLMNTKAEPHKAVTYCYANLLPIIFKTTQNEQVLHEMDQMSGRRYKKKTSSFGWNHRKERFEVTGEVSRDSETLLKWAIDAMWDMSVDFLQKEVQETYNIEPIGNTTFVWGQIFRTNLLKDYDTGRKERDVIITSEFSEVNIKNWPVRLGAALYKETREHFMKEEFYESVASQYSRTKI